MESQTFINNALLYYASHYFDSYVQTLQDALFNDSCLLIFLNLKQVCLNNRDKIPSFQHKNVCITNMICLCKFTVRFYNLSKGDNLSISGDNKTLSRSHHCCGKSHLYSVG